MLVARFAVTQVEVKAILDVANAEDWWFLSSLPSQQGIGLLFRKPEPDIHDVSQMFTQHLEARLVGNEVKSIVSSNRCLILEMKDGHKIYIKAKLAIGDDGVGVRLVVDG